MKQLSEILESAQRFEEYKYAGIYFLVSMGEVVYVGSSINVGTRLFAHRRNIRMTFQTFTIFKYDDIPQMRLDEIEYIRQLRPKYNFYYNPDCADHRRILYHKFLQIKDVYLWLKENDLDRLKVNAFFRNEKVNTETATKIESTLYPKGIPSRIKHFDHNKQFKKEDFYTIPKERK